MIVRQMKFLVENSVKMGGRLGHLQLPSPSSGEMIEYPTPMFFLHTLAGSIPHVTHEVFNLIFKNIDGPSDPLPPVQMSIDTMFTFQDAVGPSGMNISKFVGLPDSPCLLTLLNPVENFQAGFNTKHGVSIWSRHGRKELSVKLLNQIVANFQPTLFQCMSDYDVSSSTTMDKRLRKSTERTAHYLTEILVDSNMKNLKSNDDSLSSSSGQSQGPPGVLATVEPVWFKLDKIVANKALVSILEHRDQISGFCMKKNYEEKELFSNMTAHFVGQLPSDKFRYASGAFDLREIIDLVSQGFDVFDSSICTKLTSEGKALVLPSLFFSLKYTEVNKTTSMEAGHLQVNESLPIHDDDAKSLDHGATSSDLGAGTSESLSSHISQLEILDLSDKGNFEDFRPLSLDCNCYTCQRHTRSYVHHLQCTKELLGQVLLMAHNLITFDRFFKVLRFSLRHEDIVDFDKLRESVSPNLTFETEENHEEVEKEMKKVQNL